jgi:hypothetical protein
MVVFVAAAAGVGAVVAAALVGGASVGCLAQAATTAPAVAIADARRKSLRLSFSIVSSFGFEWI